MTSNTNRNTGRNHFSIFSGMTPIMAMDKWWLLVTSSSWRLYEIQLLKNIWCSVLSRTSWAWCGQTVEECRVWASLLYCACCDCTWWVSNDCAAQERVRHEFEQISVDFYARSNTNTSLSTGTGSTRRRSDHAHSGRGYVAKLDRREASRMSKGQPVEDEISEKVDGFVTYLKHKKWGLKETGDSFVHVVCESCARVF